MREKPGEKWPSDVGSGEKQSWAAPGHSLLRAATDSLPDKTRLTMGSVRPGGRRNGGQWGQGADLGRLQMRLACGDAESMRYGGEGETGNDCTPHTMMRTTAG